MESNLMFLPEYTITNETLRNIANAEYAKAVIENTTILPKWQKTLVLEAKAKTITYSLLRHGQNVSYESVKRYLNQMPGDVSYYVTAYEKALTKVDELARRHDFDERELKEIYLTFYGKTTYRTKSIPGKTQPEAILAELVKVLDWYNSLDAFETHPIIKTAIVKAKLETLIPFDEDVNSLITDLVQILCIKVSKYAVLDYYSLEEFFAQSRRRYTEYLSDIIENDDYTIWIEYVSEAVSYSLTNLAEHIKILAKDTKLAKAAGDAALTSRQERIVEYLEDFGMLQNKDFTKILPTISEDTVLRDLKDLLEKGVVVKKGKTKSSYYMLK